MNVVYEAKVVLIKCRSLAASDFGRRLLHGVSWLVFGSILGRALGMLATLIAARLLGKEVFGQLGIVQSTSAAFVTFAGFGLGVTGTRFVAEFRRTDPDRAARIMALTMNVALFTGVFAVLALVLAAPWLCSRTLAAPELTPVIRVGSLLVFFGALTGAQSGILSGFEGFRAIAIRNVIVGLLQFPMMLLGVIYFGLVGAVCALIGGAALNALVNHGAIRTESRKAGVPSQAGRWFQEWPLLWQFSLPSVLAGVMVMPVTWVCNALLVNQSDGYAQMGVYQAANSFHTILAFIATTIGTPLLPILASRAGGGNNRTNRMNILLTWVVGVTIALPLIAFPEVAQSLFGKEYAGPQFIRAFVVIMLFSCIVFYKQGLARALSLKRMMWWGFVSNCVWAGTLLPSAYWLSGYGAFGLATSYLIAYTANTVLFVPLYQRMGIVPHDTMVSSAAALIWGVLIGAAGLTILGGSLGSRALYFAISLPAMWSAFYRLAMGKR